METDVAKTKTTEVIETEDPKVAALKDAVAKYEALITDNLEGLYRSQYVLSLIPDKALAARSAKETYIKFRDALGDKGRELDRKFSGR